MKVKRIFIAGLLTVFVATAVVALITYISYVKKSEGLMDINLYYFNPSDNTLIAEKCSIVKTDDRKQLINSVEEAYREGPKTPNLIKAIPDGVDFEIINKDTVNGNVLDVDITKGFTQLKESARLVCVGSIVYTFSDISFIENVRLSVDGKNIADTYNMYGSNTASLNEENVVNNPIINPEKINRQKVVLYFLSKEGNGLVAEERSIEVKQSQTLEYQIVEQLILGPEDNDNMAAMPQGTKIKDIKTEEGICYVNLSSEFVNKLSGSTNNEKFVIYSIVNSLTELNSVNKVQFLIEGEKISEFKGHYDFSKTFERDESLIGG